MKEFNFIPNILRTSDLEKVPADPELTRQVLGIMTPPDILLGREFSRPGIIDPREYPNFQTLLADRERVCRLKLLPVKTDEEYLRYHQQTQETLERQVREVLGPDQMAAAPNLYPYWLPEDLEQSLVWIANPECERVAVAEFIAKVMALLKLGPEKVILFERPTNIDTKLIRGTFKEVRHVHFWYKLGT